MLQSIICFPDGTKRVIYDGAEYAPSDAGLTATEWAEVDDAQYVAPPVVVPESVTRFQARAALHLAGLLATVEAMMAAPEADPIARLAWQDALEFKRSSPTITALSSALGLSSAEVDQLFVVAQGIDA